MARDSAGGAPADSGVQGATDRIHDIQTLVPNKFPLSATSLFLATKIFMTQTLTTQQIGQYITQIENGGVEQARQVYDTLNGMGYNYAGWAAGVARGDSITGLSALDYLQGTAMMGLGGDACRNLTQVQIDKIRVDMATGYLEALSKIATDSGGIANRDVGYRETQQFHKEAFEKNNLTLDTAAPTASKAPFTPT